MKEAEAAVTTIEKTRDKSQQLREVAENRRRQRGGPHPDAPTVSVELLNETQDAIARVLMTTVHGLAAEGLTPEVAAPLGHAYINAWAKGLPLPYEDGDGSRLPPAHCFAAERQLQAIACVDALARLEAYCRTMPGTIGAILGVNSGGHIIASYLAYRLNLADPHKITTFDSSVQLAGFAPSGTGGTILVVDDIVRSGQTMERLRAHFSSAGHTRVKYISLVASMSGKAALGRFPLYCPVVSATRDVTLPWSTKGTLTRSGNEYLFGDPTPDSFVMQDHQADFIVREIASSGLR
jgi:hypoxanthine phosphoribosyltransferase